MMEILRMDRDRLLRYVAQQLHHTLPDDFDTDCFRRTQWAHLANRSECLRDEILQSSNRVDPQAVRL